MSSVRGPDKLESERLVLRHRHVTEAAVYRQLWTERDLRVPSHRRIDPEGRPTVEDIAAQIRAQREGQAVGLLAVERRATADVIGYCGLIFDGYKLPDEPELAYELMRAAHGFGYATEAGRAVVTWAHDAGYGRLWSRVWDWNIASRRVLEKLGFRETGRVAPTSPYGSTLLTVREPRTVSGGGSLSGDRSRPGERRPQDDRFVSDTSGRAFASRIGPLTRTCLRP